ncbi:PREDICTED: prolactin regulatory element-binding protein [Ceratosolen solmsi marchali]|uniref:Prolactin regulatory element-binding protein n=1 Tax=Ceratosolen solmsi marchali TaxID=326594 RepID=A0AAJ6YV15_9HYME|nr:PREDICTED: prolactin regulatory element-binding protein [Ceratosolen solmsi marchali]
MSWRRRKDGLLAKVNFPPYTLQMLTSRHVLVGGGGGSSRTGVANGFEIFELSHDGTQFNAEEVTRYETGPNVVMNSATHNDGKRMWLVAGQESHCQLYNIQAKVVVTENGEIPKKSSFSNKEELRQRRKNEMKEETNTKKESIEDINEESKAKHKKLQLIIKPSDSVQTDFGDVQPVQRVVRISPNGNVMATGGTDGYVRLWQFPQITKMHDLKGHDTEIDDIDFSSTGKEVATVAKDGKLIIWEVTSGLKSKELTWSSSKDEKSIFKRCRFRNKLVQNTNTLQVFTLSNSLPARDKRHKGKTHYGFLQQWDIKLESVEKLVTYKENLSELAISDDGKFVAVGTMSSGTVDMFIAFSLQRVLHVPGAHNMFITNLEFLSTKLDGPAITSNSEAAVISCSIDNKICIHSIPYRYVLPFWLFLIFIVLCICGAFMLCSYMGI